MSLDLWPLQNDLPLLALVPFPSFWPYSGLPSAVPPLAFCCLGIFSPQWNGDDLRSEGKKGQARSVAKEFLAIFNSSRDRGRIIII